MKSRRILVWTFILVLAGAAWLLNDHLEERQAIENQKAGRLLELDDPGQVVSLEFSGLDYPEPLRLERRGDPPRWWLTRPLDYPADALAVQGLLTALAQARTRARLEEHGPLAEYGLEPPRVRLTLGLPQGRDTALLAGNLSPSRQALYLARPGEGEVLLADPALRPELARGLTGWRDKTVLDFPLGGVRKVELALAGQAPVVLELEQNLPHPQWVLQGQGPADPRRVEELLYRLRGLKALDFRDRDYQPGKLGLEPPRGRVTLTLEDGGQAGLDLGLPVAGQARINARRAGGGPLLLVDSRGLEALARQAPDLLDRRLLPVDPASVRGLTLRRQGDEMVFAQKDGLWSRLSPAGGPEDGLAGRDLAWTLCRLNWEQPLPTGDYGLDGEAVTLTLSLAGDSQDVLLLGRLDRTSGLLSAKIKGQDAIYGVKPDILRQISLLQAARAQGEAPETPKGTN